RRRVRRVIPSQEALEQPAADSSAVEPPPGRRRRWPVVGVALLAVIAVASVSVAAVLYGRYRNDRDERREVRATASTMVSALTTYDYTNLDASRNKVLALSTGRFKQEYDNGFNRF